MTSPAASCRFFSKFENGPKCRILRLCVEFLKNGLIYDHQIRRTHRGGAASPTTLPDITSLAASGRLQNATTYSIMKSLIIRPLFNIESPNFTRTSMPTEASHIGYVRPYNTIIPTIAGMTKVCPYEDCCENKSAH